MLDRGHHTVAVLIHRHDAGSDDAEWRSFVVAQGFGHLAAAGWGRAVPVIVPTQYLLEGADVWLHVAAANPVLAAIAENRHAVLSVAGDWAYIPGRWKAVDGEDPALGIPTTYYAAVQLTGTVEVLADPDEIADVLRRQLGALEPGSPLADPTVHGTKLRTIRGLRLGIEAVRAKFKYGGNVDAEHRSAVATELEARGGPGDAAALEHLRRRS